jgi:hypothetical protein
VKLVVGLGQISFLVSELIDVHTWLNLIVLVHFDLLLGIDGHLGELGVLAADAFFSSPFFSKKLNKNFY